MSIPAAAAERVKAVASRLKDAPAPRTEEQFVGSIRRVERDPDVDTGSVTVQTIRNGHPASVAVRVSAAVLDQAWEWARDRKTLVRVDRHRRLIPPRDSLLRPGGLYPASLLVKLSLCCGALSKTILLGHA